MYLEFFGLSEYPFSITPNTRFLYLSKPHEDAMTALKYGIHERLGFLLMTGEVGTGKTTLIRALFEQLDSKVHTALLINPLFSVPELLCAIAKDFGVSTTEDKSPQNQIYALNEFLLKVNERGENAVLVIDEAQTLSTDALEAIRLLTNLETDQHKLLQILLVGQPELEKKLEEQQLRQLAQRITTRAYLKALNVLEMMQYVNHRICVANGGGKVFFDPKAYRLLHKETKGYPRLINLVCHRALLASFVRETSVVDGHAISQAIADLKGREFRPRWMWLKQLVFS